MYAHKACTLLVEVASFNHSIFSHDSFANLTVSDSNLYAETDYVHKDAIIIYNAGKNVTVYNNGDDRQMSCKNAYFDGVNTKAELFESAQVHAGYNSTAQEATVLLISDPSFHYLVLRGKITLGNVLFNSRKSLHLGVYYLIPEKNLHLGAYYLIPEKSLHLHGSVLHMIRQ